MSEVEVDEMFGFCRRVSPSPSSPSPLRRWNIHTMGHEASKVSPDNAMPCGTLAFVKCSLDVLGNVLPFVIY